MSLVITGNPGVGKHTIADKISKILNYKILDINKIAIKEGIYKKNDDVFDVDATKLKKILKTKITKKTLVVGHLAPYVVNKSQLRKAIILRKSPYKLISVYKKRKYSKEKIAENLGSEILGIIVHDAIKKFGKNKIFQIDTTTNTISKTTRKIQSALKSDIKEDQVDWLLMISEKKDLKKFFSY